MSYLEILVAIIFCSLIFILLAPNKNTLLFLSWNSPLMKLMPTVYLKSHELYDKMTQVLAENKGTILLKTSWFTNLDTLVTSDPTNVQHVMSSNYQRGSEFRKAFDFLGDAAFIKDLHEWREEKKFTHAFYKENQFHKSTPKIIHHTLEKGLITVLDHALHQNQVINLQNLFNRYMLDATCLLATGFDLGSLRVGFPKAPLLDAMDDMAEAVFFRHILPERVWRMQRWLRIGKEKKLAEASVVVHQILGDYLSKKYENQETCEDFDVLRFYLSEAAGDSKKSIKHAEKTFLVANITTLLFAGRDTSGALLTWLFYLISTNPLVENKILEEIRQIISPPKHYIFYKAEELSKLVYLQSALTESLRLFPPVPVIIRDPIREDVLPSGHKVDQKTKIILCTYAMGRMPEIWGEDCGEFKPERWISGKGSSGVKHVASNSFLAFGSGQWACPGREVAFTRMKAVVATILHNYHVQVLEGQRISPSVSALLTMKHGLKATISSR
ncbi:hypothetical protein DH2020_040680 [Rehmannia glutinosa]|uniref:Cytochrome P450 protein n=1 Tax=Rehmannia glutinosa TaxID=99300 RepID=A0ABR0UT09_REHGL